MSDENGLKMRALYWIAGKLPSCEAITRMVSESFERPLTAHERLRKRLHFLICVWCMRYERQMGLVRRTVREHAGDAERDSPVAAGLSQEARERMKRALANAAS